MCAEQPNVLILGRKDKTLNYCNAVTYHQMSYEVTETFHDAGIYDGLILPGGGDIEPALYGCRNTDSIQIDLPMDLEQLAALNAFIRMKKPVLGICKGIQIINVWFGGTLCQQIAQVELHKKMDGDVMHGVNQEEGSIFNTLFGDSVIVNSCHHQSIERIGKGLRVIQSSKDGLIEGMIHDELPIIGVQWHPERMCKAYQGTISFVGDTLFQYFKNCIEKNRKRLDFIPDTKL